LPTASGNSVVTVPVSAVIDSGTRRVVLVKTGEGRFESRDVKLGARGDDYVEVTDGVKEGEPVVVAANFLIDAESNLKAAVGALGSGSKAAEAPARSVSHEATGRLETIDAQAGTATISHGPIADLKWPAMTMEFALANASLLGKLKPGDAIAFSFVERKPGEWVIVKIEPAPASAHAGH